MLVASRRTSTPAELTGSTPCLPDAFYERLAERAGDALDTYEINIYRHPRNDGVLESIQQLQGAQVRVHPVHLSRFLRPQPM